jgi:hypothetical protein
MTVLDFHQRLNATQILIRLSLLAAAIAAGMAIG